MTTTTTITVGKSYHVTSSRKGTFVGTLLKADDTWATIQITSGKAGAMLPENVREVGEEVTVRREFCTFTEVPEKGLRVRLCEKCHRSMPRKNRPQTCPACGHVHERGRKDA